MNILTDLVPAKYRQAIHALLVALAAAFSIWQASDGNLETFLAGLAALLYTGSNLSNTHVPAVEETPVVPAIEDINYENPDELAGEEVEPEFDYDEAEIVALDPNEVR